MIKNLRILGIIEGISYLILLVIAMPMKYFMGLPLAVKFVGMTHGVLFVVYCSLLTLCMQRFKWSFGFGLYLFIATLIPFGTFVTDKKLNKLEP
ncbi:MAG: DUF3817 domain-containing protein [Opitutales bacterium]